jgi:hypothetical protein
MYYRARFYHPALGRFISADTIVPEPGQPQDFNRYSYVRNSPLRFVDPTGHFTCEGDPNCHETIEEWLRILEEEGGDVGAHLVNRFRILDGREVCDGSGTCISLPVTISIVDDVGAMAAGVGTIWINRGVFESANQSEEMMSVLAGAFGHEIFHLVEQNLSLRAEIAAYEAQYQIYEAMGFYDSENESSIGWVRSVRYVHENIAGLPDRELVRTSFARDYYGSFPLTRELAPLDNSIGGYSIYRLFFLGRPTYDIALHVNQFKMYTADPLNCSNYGQCVHPEW